MRVSLASVGCLFAVFLVWACGESPTGGKLINYVDAALSDVDAGRPVATPETEAYGCSVKYGS